MHKGAQILAAPIPTLIFRIVHIDNLETLMRRGGLHAPSATPKDGLEYRVIHNTDIQAVRRVQKVPCGPCGTEHDYVPFYFGYLSPMLLQLKTGRVTGYNESQEPLVYLFASAQDVADANIPFVFSDGHGIAAFTEWYDDLCKLDQVDWDMVYQRYWADRPDDLDRQRRKQAEFLIHEFCPWSLINEIAVINQSVRMRVENIMADFDEGMKKPVSVKAEWYY
jgi:hypothetical protein